MYSGSKEYLNTSRDSSPKKWNDDSVIFSSPSFYYIFFHLQNMNKDILKFDFYCMKKNMLKISIVFSRRKEAKTGLEWHEGDLLISSCFIL